MDTQQKSKLHISTAEHPILGNLTAASTNQGLVYFSFGPHKSTIFKELGNLKGSRPILGSQVADEKGISTTAIQQVQEYLDGKRNQFTIPINWHVFSSFQAKVYRALIAIPYGQTRTYSQIAAQLCQPKAARAVGRANASNPLPIIIPCHRLVGTDGSLRGYGGSGGLQTKQWLLDHERNSLTS